MKRWLKKRLKELIGRLARFIAHELRDEFSESKLDDRKHIKIDVSDFVQQLGSWRVKHDLIRFMKMSHRWIVMLEDRNRRTAAATNDFVNREMKSVLFHTNQYKVIESKRDQMHELGGYILDLGIYIRREHQALGQKISPGNDPRVRFVRRIAGRLVVCLEGRVRRRSGGCAGHAR